MKRPTLELGTAQFGDAYGITNRSGRPSDDTVRAICATATRLGFSSLDTARAYGDSESRIGSLLDETNGRSLGVVTKITPFSEPLRHAGPAPVARAVVESLGLSLAALGRRAVDVLMFHRAADLLCQNGAGVDALVPFVESGTIGALGVSVSSPEEAIACLEDPRVSELQIPFNLLDDRWLEGAFTACLGRRPGVRVHVRSAFLQGLLLADRGQWPTWFTGSGALLAALDEEVGACGRTNRLDLCLAYLRATPFVDVVVLGFESASQLEEVATIWTLPALRPSELPRVRRLAALGSPRLIDPAAW